jgi:hypothetical protein
MYIMSRFSIFIGKQERVGPTLDSLGCWINLRLGLLRIIVLHTLHRHIFLLVMTELSG